MGKRWTVVVAWTLVSLLAVGAASAWASPKGFPTGTPITGTVTWTAWRGDDLYVEVDVNRDGRGDVWFKVEHRAAVVDGDGRPLGLSAVGTGTSVTATAYEFDDGYYEVYRLVVGTAAAGAEPGAFLSGTVQQSFSFGDHIFVSLAAPSGASAITAKIRRNALVADRQGKRLALDEIRPGRTLTLAGYRLDRDGYYEVWHVIVEDAGTPASPGSPTAPVEGEVVDRIEMAGALFLRLVVASPASGGSDAGERVVVEARLGPSARLLDPSGRTVSREAVQRGSRLRLSRYEPNGGYLEVSEAVVAR